MEYNNWSDMVPDMRIDQSGNVGVVRNAESIQQSLKNLLSTVQGERVRSDIGSGLNFLLFESVDDDTAEDIRETITYAIERHENRINLLGVTVIPYPDENYYEIVIRFRERNSISPQEMRSFLEQQQ